jgi:hypothetical protein
MPHSQPFLTKEHKIIKEIQMQQSWQSFDDEIKSHAEEYAEEFIMAVRSQREKTPLEFISPKIYESILSGLKQLEKYFFLKTKHDTLLLNKTQFDPWNSNSFMRNPLPHFQMAKESARMEVLNLLYQASPSFYFVVKKAFQENYIDLSEPNDRKLSAFTISFQDSRFSQITVDLAGTEQDTIILAHELGHFAHRFWTPNEQWRFHAQMIPLKESIAFFFEGEITSRLPTPERQLAIGHSMRLAFVRLAALDRLIQKVQSHLHLFEARKVQKSHLLSNWLAEELSPPLGEDFAFKDKLFWAKVDHIRSPRGLKLPKFYLIAQSIALALRTQLPKDGMVRGHMLRKFITVSGTSGIEFALREFSIPAHCPEFWFNVIKEELENSINPLLLY